MKKILSFIIAFVMIISISSVAFAADKGDGSGIGEENAWDISVGGDGSIYAYLTQNGSEYTLNIVGSGVMKDFPAPNVGNKYYAHTPWHGLKHDGSYAEDSVHTKITTVNLDTRITAIGSNTFRDMSGITVMPALSDKITYIGDNAFNGCSNMAGTDLILPETLTTLGGKAFLNCRQLTGNLYIPASLTKVGKQAFAYCGFNGTLTVNCKWELLASVSSVLTGIPFTGGIKHTGRDNECSYI